MLFADLHLHTRFSDGTYTPEELVNKAQALGFGVLALTDHDTVEGCAPMFEICPTAGIEFISGTELTAEMNGSEVHFLAYFVNIHHPPLLQALSRFQITRQTRICEMVARLNELDIPLHSDSVFALANCRSPGRPHVGRALVQAGYCITLDEAFDRFLKKNRPAWVPKFKMSAAEAMALIHDAGGVAVMAHPGLNRSDAAIPALVEAGLDGLECYHSKHAPETVEHYLRIAREHRLLITGGSDCHGHSKGKPTMGSVKLPYEYVERLKARAAERKSTPKPPQACAPLGPSTI